MARDEPVGRVGEEEGGAGHVVGLPEPAERRPARDLSELVAIEAVAHLGAQVPRRDAVHGDAARPELAGERPGQAVERGLGRSVHVEPAVAGETNDRGDVDDLTGSPGQHHAARGSGDIDRALQVQVDHLVECVVAEQADDTLTGHAGIVDEDVEASPARRRLLHEALRVGRVRDVDGAEVEALLEFRVLLPGLDGVRRGAGARLDAVAGLEKGVDQPSPQAAATTGDEGDTRRRFAHWVPLTVLPPWVSSSSTKLMLRGCQARGRAAVASFTARRSASASAVSVPPVGTTSTATMEPVSLLGRP